MVIRLGQRSHNGQWRQRLIDADCNRPCMVLFSVVDVVINRAMWSRRQRMQGLWLPKALVSSDGIWNLPITSLSVDNSNDRALWCKPTGINYNMHGWILCRYCATGWFWWISGLPAVAMWSSSSFTKMSTIRTRIFCTAVNKIQRFRANYTPGYQAV